MVEDAVLASSPGPDEALVGDALTSLRRHLGMDVAFIGRFADGRRTFRSVSGDDGCPVRVGDGHDLEDSYCQRIVDGRIPAAIPDVSLEPEVSGLGATAELGIGAYLGVPVRLPDGRLYGTLCCYSGDVRRELSPRDAAALRLVVDIIVPVLAREVERREAAEAARRHVDEVLAEGRLTAELVPVVDLRDGAAVGFVAVTRVDGGDPAPLLAAAAEAGMSTDVEVAAARAALALLPDVPQGCYLALPTSPATAVADALADALADAPGERLVLQLPGPGAAGDLEGLATALSPLRRRGVRVALDGVDDSRAGMQGVRDVAPDIVVLSPELTRGVDADPARQALLRALLWFCQLAGAGVVAAGLDDHWQERELLRMGVRHGVSATSTAAAR